MEFSIEQELREGIRQVPDFPKPGINFYDITTLLKNGALFQKAVAVLVQRYRPLDPAAVVAIEARGFIFGGALADQLGCSFVPARKPGKLPAETQRVSYALEYGKDALEMHKDALRAGDRVVIVDDLLATGGTARGTIELCTSLGAAVIESAFVIELSFLQGREKLAPVPVFSMVQYNS